MTENRAFELLSAAADGDLSRDEQAELETLLSHSDDARQLQRELNQMSEFLESAPELDPPADLRDTIMQQAVVRASRPTASTASVNPVAQWLESLRWGALLRYGVSTAFGALLVIAVYESQPNFGASPDITELVGTMSPDGGGSGNRVVLDRISVDGTGVSSIARLEQRDGALVLDIRVDAENDVEVAIDFSSTGLEFEALAQTSSRIDALQFAEKVLKVNVSGRRRFAVLLRQVSDTPFAEQGSIDLEYSSNGTILQQGSLRSDR